MEPPKIRYFKREKHRFIANILQSGKPKNAHITYNINNSICNIFVIIPYFGEVNANEQQLDDRLG